MLEESSKKFSVEPFSWSYYLQGIFGFVFWEHALKGIESRFPVGVGNEVVDVCITKIIIEIEFLLSDVLSDSYCKKKKLCSDFNMFCRSINFLWSSV